jgi:serine/threonine-protein kinase RsbT
LDLYVADDSTFPQKDPESPRFSSSIGGRQPAWVLNLERGTMSNLGVGKMDSGECVWLTSDPDIVTARERGRALAETLGFSAADQASVETTISDLAINMLTYARSGEIRLEIVSDARPTGLRIVARDWGSGANNPGLSEVQRLTDDVEIDSRAGRGTVVTVTKWLSSAKDSAA